MNKAEFISAVSEAAGSSKSEATAHVEAIINVVTNTLKSDNEVTLVGLVHLKLKNAKQEQVEILGRVSPFKLRLQQYLLSKLAKHSKMLLISIPN